MAASQQHPALAERTSGLAVASLVLSCLGFLMMGPFASVPGVVCGHLARRECRLDPALKGDQLALAGLIVGYLNLALYGVIVVVLVVLLAFGLLFALVVEQPAEQQTPRVAPAPVPQGALRLPQVGYVSAGPPMAMGTWIRVVRSAARACLRAALSRSGSSALTPMAPQASAICA